MEIAVCVKQVPRPGSVRAAGDHLDWKEGHDADLNPFALNTVEAAVRMAKRQGGRVTVLAAGDESCDELLRAAMALGAHRAVRVQAPPLLRQDAQVLARCLAAAVQELDDIDLVITGMHSAVGGPGLVPSMMAEILGWPLVSNVSGIKEVSDCTADIQRRSAEGLELVRMETPAVISVLRDIADATMVTSQVPVARETRIRVIPTPPEAVPATNIAFFDAPPAQPAVFLASPPAAAVRELLVRLRQDRLYDAAAGTGG